MLFNKGQKITVLVFLGMFFALYFGCNTVSKEIKDLEKFRAENLKYLDIDREIHDSYRQLTTDQQVELENLNVDLESTLEDSLKITIYKELSSKWYSFKNPIVAGHYAEKVAELTNNEDSWSICGSTYYIGMMSADVENKKKFAFQKAVSAFDKGIELNPDNVDLKINKALCSVEMPPEENPMAGILQIMDLEKEYPNSYQVQLQLGRLGIRTKQWEKAIGRFEKVLSLEPRNVQAHCYLLEIYTELKNSEKIELHRKLCVR